MAYIERDGVKVYYEAEGQGPAILLSHGYSATGRMWRGQVAALKDSYRVITWDMRGHGETDSPEDQSLYSEEVTVDDMAAILRECGVSEAVIGGLSLGGYMSLAFYLKYPQMTRALMLFDTGPGYRNPQGREAWNQTAFRRAERLEQGGLASLTGGDEVRQSMHRSAAGLAKAARGMLAQFDSRVIESLESIKVPTLVLVGANDEAFLQATDYMANKIPGAKKVVIADAGHAANIHQPAAFNEAVLSFLREAGI
ncbi:MAG TPA: alpha/beta fold hydrolase [Dehalococcoidia bacterium]|nr:alpha/beta fold hydrolase [Dehalococcoidia bacterium]